MINEQKLREEIEKLKIVWHWEEFDGSMAGRKFRECNVCCHMENDPEGLHPCEVKNQTLDDVLSSLIPQEKKANCVQSCCCPAEGCPFHGNVKTTMTTSTPPESTEKEILREKCPQHKGIMANYSYTCNCDLGKSIPTPPLDSLDEEWEKKWDGRWTRPKSGECDSGCCKLWEGKRDFQSEGQKDFIRNLLHSVHDRAMKERADYVLGLETQIEGMTIMLKSLDKAYEAEVRETVKDLIHLARIRISGTTAAGHVTVEELEYYLKHKGISLTKFSEKEG